MPNEMDELVNRVATRLWQLASAKITRRVELEVARLQTELLEHAAMFRHGYGKIGEQVAGRLETVSARLIQDALEESSDVEWSRDLESGVGFDGVADLVGEMPVCTSVRAGKRPRGRPKKVSASEEFANQPANREASTPNDEVTNEERTGAHDPSGTDQVRDLPTEDVQR